jgi:hypothetical protein
MQPDLFILDDLGLLSEKQEKWCLSMFMPTHRVTSLVQENQIRFKNLLRKAEDILGSRASDLPMDDLKSLLNDRPFWHDQADGLALFCAPGVFRSYRLPIPVEELVTVSERFHLKPVLPLLSTDGRFFVLALSQNAVKLLQCTAYGVSEVELGEVPTSLEEALRFDEPEKQLQFNTRAPSRPGKRAAMFHGHGVGVDDAKDRILRFFQQLDKALQNHLGDDHSPLVIAAVDYLVPIFKHASSYQHILDQTISGNPEGIPMEELHAKAMEVIGPRFEKEIHDQSARYQDLAGTDLASDDLEEIVKAAYHGRTDVLFVAVGERRWGHFDSQADDIRLAHEGHEGAYDLLDYAAARTLENGGKVYALSLDDMPHKELLAAIYRY